MQGTDRGPEGRWAAGESGKRVGVAGAVRTTPGGGAGRVQQGSASSHGCGRGGGGDGAA